MAGRDPDGDGPWRAARRRHQPLTVCGLEVGLLDVGRVVALNGYPEACRRLAFVSPSFYLERDLLMATKRVRYGGKQRTRLMSLSRAGDVERVTFLLKVGAETEAQDRQRWTPLHLASYAGHEPIVRLLLDKSADVGTTMPDGCTPLHVASQEGHESVVRLLLDRGADANVTASHSATPLRLASANGHESIVHLLREAGAV
jgi:ankyrin repeat protein